MSGWSMVHTESAADWYEKHIHQDGPLQCELKVI